MSKYSINELKQSYVKYYEDVPVQCYAALYIGRDEDTIIRWRKEDSSFAEAVQRAKAEWVRKKVIATKAEFALERLEKSIFSQHSNVEIIKKSSVKKVTDEEVELFTEWLKQRVIQE